MRLAGLLTLGRAGLLVRLAGLLTLGRAGLARHLSLGLLALSPYLVVHRVGAGEPLAVLPGLDE